MIQSTWTLPVLIAATTLIGLVAALTGDGWRDALAWIGLAIPLFATGWAVLAQRRSSTSATPTSRNPE